MSCGVFEGVSSASGAPSVPLIGIIVAGPCACGKSEVASALAKYFQVPFVDADSLHSESNIKKMSSGIPLEDDDRLPWLIAVRKEIILQKKVVHNTVQNKFQRKQVGVVAACSALTRKYRNILRGIKERDISQVVSTQDGDLPVIFVFLNCSQDVLQNRLNQRKGHFMKAGMLSSQLATLEVPNDEVQQGHAIIVDGDAELVDVLKEATEKLQSLLVS